MPSMRQDDMDDLLGVAPGPMLGAEEAAMRGRDSETLVPKNTFVTYREVPRGGQLTVRQNAFNTGRVKVLTTENQERDFPREGGLPFKNEEERKMSYRDHAQTYTPVNYLSVKPRFGPLQWPAKQLFPTTPTINKIDSIEHDIIPPSAGADSNRNFNVTDLDGDDSRRLFLKKKGGMGMLYGLKDERAFVYGEPIAGSESSVNEHDILTVTDWDDQNADWQLNGLGGIKLVNWAAAVATRIAHKALVLMRANKIQTVTEFESFVRTTAAKVATKKAGALPAILSKAADEAIKVARPAAEAIAARDAKRADALLSRAARIEQRSAAQAQALRARAGTINDSNLKDYLMGGEELPEYADGSETDGWTGFADLAGKKKRGFGMRGKKKGRKGRGFAPSMSNKPSPGSAFSKNKSRPSGTAEEMLPVDVAPGVVPEMPGLPASVPVSASMPNPMSDYNDRAMYGLNAFGKRRGFRKPSRPSHKWGAGVNQMNVAPRVGLKRGGGLMGWIGDFIEGFGAFGKRRGFKPSRPSHGRGWGQGVRSMNIAPKVGLRRGGGLMGLGAADSATTVATNVVNAEIANGNLQTGNQVMSAITAAAKTAADMYAQKRALDAAKKAAPAPTIAPMMARAGTFLADPDQPLWKRPLFWVGALGLVVGGGYMAFSGPSKGTKRRRR